jgi:hypothetical protein
MSDFNASTERFVSFPRIVSLQQGSEANVGFSHRRYAAARRQQGGGGKSPDNVTYNRDAGRTPGVAQLFDLADISGYGGEKGWCPGAESSLLVTV